MAEHHSNWPQPARPASANRPASLIPQHYFTPDTIPIAWMYETAGHFLHNSPHLAVSVSGCSPPCTKEGPRAYGLRCLEEMAIRCFPPLSGGPLLQNTNSAAYNYIAGLLNNVEIEPNSPGRVRTLIWTEERSTALYTARGRVDPYRHLALQGPGRGPATGHAPTHPCVAELPDRPHSGCKSSCIFLRHCDDGFELKHSCLYPDHEVSAYNAGWHQSQEHVSSPASAQAAHQSECFACLAWMKRALC